MSKVIFSILLALLVSCKTMPVIQDTVTEIFPLDKGASVYVFADVKKAQFIINLLPVEALKNKQAEQLVERTDFFVAALFPLASGRRFQLAAWGNYPSSRANLAFGFTKHWKKQRTETGHYWYSAADKLSVSLNQRQAYVAASANNKPVNPLAAVGGVTVPEGFSQFRQGSPFSCWINDPAPMLNRLPEALGIPVKFPAQQLFINLYPAGENQYEMVLRVQFENALQARGISAALSLAARFSLNDSGTMMSALFLANPPVHDGSSLDIKTARLTEREITLLLEMFFI